MSQFTQGLTMPLLTPGLSGHVPHNDALIILDEIVGRGVIDARADAPGSPANWDMYIVWEGIATTTPGNAWDGKANQIAIRYNNAWRFITPRHGLRVWNRSDNTIWVFGTSTWSVMGAGQACAAMRSTTDRDSTSNAWAQLNFDTNDLLPSNSFIRGTGGDGVGDVKVMTAGTYMAELNAAIQVTSATATSMEVAFAINGGQNSTTPATSSIRRQALANIATLFDRQIIHVQHVFTLGAGQYVAPLFRNMGTSGTAVGTVRVRANENTFRITKLNP
jgi:hypothetical protein